PGRRPSLGRGVHGMRPGLLRRWNERKRHGARTGGAWVAAQATLHDAARPEQEAPVNASRLSAILVVIAILLGSLTPVDAQFDPAKATWRLRTTKHFAIYYPSSLDPGSIPHEAERAYTEMSRERHQQVSEKVLLMLLPTTA